MNAKQAKRKHFATLSYFEKPSDFTTINHPKRVVYLVFLVAKAYGIWLVLKIESTKRADKTWYLQVGCLNQESLPSAGFQSELKEHRLGHSGASLTINIYAYVIATNDRDAADTIGATIFGDSKEEG